VLDYYHCAQYLHRVAKAHYGQPFQHADLCAMSLAVETCLPF
jgi:hypothetical protein